MIACGSPRMTPLAHRSAIRRNETQVWSVPDGDDVIDISCRMAAPLDAAIRMPPQEPGTKGLPFEVIPSSRCLGPGTSQSSLALLFAQPTWRTKGRGQGWHCAYLRPIN